MAARPKEPQRRLQQESVPTKRLQVNMQPQMHDLHRQKSGGLINPGSSDSEGRTRILQRARQVTVAQFLDLHKDHNKSLDNYQAN